jgi:cell volume regulation protein A
LSLALNVDFLFFLATITILLGIVGELVSRRYPVPIPLFLLLLGYLLGVVSLPKLFGQIFHSSNTSLLPLPVSPFLTIAPLFATFAIMMILFYGGMELKISRLSQEIPRVLIQVNAYVLAGILAVALLTILFLHWDVWSSLLMGSIVGGETTAAVVVPMTKIVRMRNETKTFLILESALNSIYSVVFFFGFLREVQGQSLGVAGVFSAIGIAVLAGVLCGLGFGYLWRWISPFLDDFDFKYILVLAFVLVAYLISNFFYGGGLVSSLIFGFVAFRTKSTPKGKKTFEENGIEELGIAESKVRVAVETPPPNSGPATNTIYLSTIQHEITLLLETFFFVLMGLLLTEIPSSTVYTTLLYGGIFTMVLFGIRLGASRLSTLRSSIIEDRNLILFTMAQGLTPAVLAVSTFTYSLPNAPIYLGLTLAVILYTNLITVAVPFIARMRSSLTILKNY